MRNWFQKAYDWLAGIGRYLRRVILDMLSNAFKDFMKKMGPTIEGILKEIQEDPSIVADEDRRKAAYDKIKKAAKDAGIEVVKDSIIYTAIEMILQALKNREDLPTNAGG
jgi:hypothetical protein